MRLAAVFMLFFAFPAWAQTTDPVQSGSVAQQQSQEGEAIVVTGSRIRRDPLTAGLSG